MTETEEIVARFREYVSTYNTNEHFKVYPLNFLIEDMIYGIGIAVEPEEFKGSDGYEKFKEHLKTIFQEHERVEK